MHVSFTRLVAATASLASCLTLWSMAEPIRVTYPQGSSHGFLAVKTLEGVTIGMGEMTQTVHGDQVKSRLVIRFRDGSVDEDMTVFTQREVFRLVSDHHIQRGPSFPTPMDMLIDAVTGEITESSPDSSVDCLSLG